MHVDSHFDKTLNLRFSASLLSICTTCSSFIPTPQSHTGLLLRRLWQSHVLGLHLWWQWSAPRSGSRAWTLLTVKQLIDGLGFGGWLIESTGSGPWGSLVGHITWKVFSQNWIKWRKKINAQVTYYTAFDIGRYDADRCDLFK